MSLYYNLSSITFYHAVQLRISILSNTDYLNYHTHLSASTHMTHERVPLTHKRQTITMGNWIILRFLSYTLLIIYRDLSFTQRREEDEEQSNVYEWHFGLVRETIALRTGDTSNRWSFHVYTCRWSIPFGESCSRLRLNKRAYYKLLILKMLSIFVVFLEHTTSPNTNDRALSSPNY